MVAFAGKYAYGPTRVQFENKDPRGFAQFKKELGEHSALGSANTQLGVQGARPSLYELVDKMRALTVPTLVLTCDNDYITPSYHAEYIARTIPGAKLVIPKGGGHSFSKANPEEFNRIVLDFLAAGK